MIGKNGLILLLATLFIITVINTSMANDIWPTQSTWNGDWPKLNIIIKNGIIEGSCDIKGWTMDGTVSSDGKILTGHWYNTSGKGRYMFKLSSDGEFIGLWGHGEDEPSLKWYATLISSSGISCISDNKNITPKPSPTPSSKSY